MYKTNDENAVIFRTADSPFALGDIVVDGQKVGTIQLSPVEFQLLFTPQEFRAMQELRKTDDDLNYAWSLAELKGFVNPTSAALEGFLQESGMTPPRRADLAQGKKPK